MVTNEWLTAAVLLFSTPIVLIAEGQTFDRTLNVSTQQVDLSAITGAGHVRVRTGPPGQVAIRGRIRGNLTTRWVNDPPIVQDGNRVIIGDISDDSFFHDRRISYDITVPADTRAFVHTGSGNIEVSGLKGVVKVETGSGVTRLRDISSDVTVSGGSGQITLERLGGTVTANSKSGRIAISDKPLGAWNLRTSSGRVSLALPSGAAFQLRAQTSSGAIVVDYPVKSGGSKERHYFEGTAGEGGPRIEINTSSGKVQVSQTENQQL